MKTYEELKAENTSLKLEIERLKTPRKKTERERNEEKRKLVVAQQAAVNHYRYRPRDGVC